MSDVNRAYETATLRDPANWFWVHNRWKPLRASGTRDGKLRNSDFGWLVRSSWVTSYRDGGSAWREPFRFRQAFSFSLASSCLWGILLMI